MICEPWGVDAYQNRLGPPHSPRSGQFASGTMPSRAESGASQLSAATEPGTVGTSGSIRPEEQTRRRLVAFVPTWNTQFVNERYTQSSAAPNACQSEQMTAFAGGVKSYASPRPIRVITKPRAKSASVSVRIAVGSGAADLRTTGRFVEPCRTRASASDATHPRPATVRILCSAPFIDRGILS